MTALKSFTLATFSVFLLAGPAVAAVSVTNETDQTHTVTFDHGDRENTHELAPAATVEEACPKGCGVRFSGHDFLAVDGDRLKIEAGATRPTPADS